MITCILGGGLGNQLFQIFTTISTAFRLNVSFGFLNTDKLSPGFPSERPTYWKTCFSPLQPQLFELNDTRLNDCTSVQESIYDITSLDPNNSYALIGDFQDTRYFSKYSKMLIMYLKVPSRGAEIASHKEYPPIIWHNTVAMHFRFGDYKQHKHIYAILTYDYYYNALCKILQHISDEDNIPFQLNVLYFYDKSHTDDEAIVQSILERLRMAFPHVIFRAGVDVIGVPGNCAEFDEMVLMSLCKYKIIANSTFSWWGAYFAMSSRANTVYYPDTWFINSEKNEKNRKAIIHPSWVAVPNMRSSSIKYVPERTKWDFIFLIFTCKKYEHKALQQKETWLKHIPDNIKYYHVLGDPHMNLNYQLDKINNILYVRTPDDYNSLPQKVIMAYAAISHAYEYKYIFKTDDDQNLQSPTFLDSLTRMLSSPKYHYGGEQVVIKQNHKSQYHTVHPELPPNIPLDATTYCAGRFYFLSALAVKYLCKHYIKFRRQYFEDHAVGLFLPDALKAHIMKIPVTLYFKDNA